MNKGFIERRQRGLVIGTSFIYLGLIILSIYLVWIRKLANLHDTYIINLGVDIFGMIVGYLLFTSSIIDIQKTGANHRNFLYLLNIAFVALFVDLVAWLVDGLPNMRIVNIIDNTIYYACMPVAAYFFWLYVKNVMRVETKLGKIIGTIMQYFLIVALISRVVNLFTGMFFTVDEAGVYSRGPLYPASMLYAYFTTTATIILIIRHRKNLATYQVVILILYMILPTAAGVFTTKVYGLSISYAVVMAILLFMYCVLNISQGREKAVVDKELSMATAIQENSIPHIYPAFPERNEFDLYGRMDPAKEVGGDFYDYFLIDDDHLALVMADVSGKGVPAALFMMASKIMIGNLSKIGKMDPAEILEKVNNQICEGNSQEMFVTVWLGILEISTGKLTAANAGHEYPAVKLGDKGFELYKDKHGLVVGGMSGIKYTDYEVYLKPGDAIFLYTDGVPEATDASEKLFGTERMIEALNKDPNASPEEVLENVRAGVDAFVKNAEQFDDLTMLCLKYRGA